MPSALLIENHYSRWWLKASSRFLEGRDHAASAYDLILVVVFGRVPDTWQMHSKYLLDESLTLPLSVVCICTCFEWSGLNSWLCTLIPLCLPRTWLSSRFVSCQFTPQCSFLWFDPSVCIILASSIISGEHPLPQHPDFLEQVFALAFWLWSKSDYLPLLLRVWDLEMSKLLELFNTHKWCLPT